MDLGQGLASFGNSLGEAMLDYHKQHQQYDQQMQLAEALSRLGVNQQGQITQIDPNSKDKSIQSIVDPKALQMFQTKSHEGQVKAAGALEAINRMAIHGLAPVIGQLGQEQLKAHQLANQRYNVDVGGGQTIPATAGQAIESAQMAPVRQAETEHIKEETQKSRDARGAARQQATVMMDIGGGNFARVPVEELLKHPDFLKDQSAKDLNNQVFASTGLGIPQIAQGWNKRVVNGQLTFDAPVIQQTIDPISQKPVPKYNADGTPAYEQIANPAYKGGKTDSPTITKTMRYQVPQEFTPDVLRLTGTHDVQGAEQLSIPAKEDRSTKIVPKSLGVGTGPQVGDTRMINGIQAQWDGHGWVAVGQ